METEASVCVRNRSGLGRKEEGAVRGAALCSRPDCWLELGRAKGAGGSTLMWWRWAWPAGPASVWGVHECWGQGMGEQGRFCNACLSAERWANISATGYFPEAFDSLCHLCKTFLKERSICSAYITSFYIRRGKQVFRAYVLLNVVQSKLLSLSIVRNLTTCVNSTC